MTVKDLIKELKNFPQEAEVKLLLESPVTKGTHRIVEIKSFDMDEGDLLLSDTP